MIRVHLSSTLTNYYLTNLWFLFIFSFSLQSVIIYCLEFLTIFCLMIPRLHHHSIICLSNSKSAHFRSARFYLTKQIIFRLHWLCTQDLLFSAIQFFFQIFNNQIKILIPFLGFKRKRNVYVCVRCGFII